MKHNSCGAGVMSHVPEGGLMAWELPGVGGEAACLLTGRSTSVRESVFPPELFFPCVLLFHLPLCFGAGEWASVHSLKFHFVFWEIRRTNNAFEVSVWSSKTFPGQKVLSIRFLRPSKLCIMEDASSFKDLVVCSLMLATVSLTLLCPPRLLCKACGSAEGYGERFLLQLDWAPGEAWGKHLSCGCAYLFFPQQGKSVLNFSVSE